MSRPSVTNVWRDAITVIVLVAAAAALRLTNLGAGIWFDEMLTVVRYMPLSLTGIATTFDDANNHVLFTLAARVSQDLLGESVAALRLPAALFGIGSIVAVYFLARRVVSWPESVFAALLLTFSYHHIWFSQNARGYTALMFFTLVSSHLLLRALDSNRRTAWLTFAIVAFLGAYTHLTIAFLCVAQFAIYVARQSFAGGVPFWQRLTGLFYGFIPLGLLTIVAYATVLPDLFGGGLLGSGLQRDGIAWLNPLWALMEIVNAMQVGFAGGGVAVVAVTVFGVGLISFALGRSPELAALFFIPCALGFLLMTSIGYTLFPRFFFFAFGFAAIIVMHGMAVTASWVAGRLRLPALWQELAAPLGCVAIVAASLASLTYVYAPKQMFEEAIAYIEAERAPDDMVVAIGIAGFPLNDFHQMNWPEAETPERFEALQSEPARSWAVYTMPVHASAAYPDILDRLGQDYEEVRRFRGTLNGGDIVISLEK